MPDVLPDALLGALAARLTADDLPAALGVLVDGLGLRSAVLRDPAGRVLAVAGDVVRPVPDDALPLHPAAAVALPVRGAAGELAVLVVSGARPSALPVLRSAADVLALALRAPAPAPAGPSGAVTALLAAAEDALDGHADALHDGPVQALVAARWAVDAAMRNGVLPALDGQDLRDAVQDALVGLRRALWHLRPRGARDLAEALSALAARQAEAGAPALTLALDEAASAALPPAAGAVAYRLVQAAARESTRPVRCALRLLPDGDVALDLDGAVPLVDPDGWRTRVAAVGGDLSSSAGRLRVRLPGSTGLSGPSSVPSQRTPETKACS